MNIHKDTLIDATEYEELFPTDSEFDAWVAECEKVLTISVNVNRDRFLFDQDDEYDEFSPFNTVNS